jgi:hypothetical protein
MNATTIMWTGQFIIALQVRLQVHPLGHRHITRLLLMHTGVHIMSTPTLPPDSILRSVIAMGMDIEEGTVDITMAAAEAIHSASAVSV